MVSVVDEAGHPDDPRAFDVELVARRMSIVPSERSVQVMIVDGRVIVREGLSALLQREPDLECRGAGRDARRGAPA